MMAQSIGSLRRQYNVGQNLLHQLFISWWHNFTCMPSIVAHFYLMTQIYRSLNCRYPLISTHVQYLKCFTTDNLAFENWYVCIFCALQNVQLISIKENLLSHQCEINHKGDICSWFVVEIEMWDSIEMSVWSAWVGACCISVEATALHYLD